MLDKIRKGIPNLTLSQIDMLAFLAFKSLKTECNNINDLKSCFKDIDVLKNAILKMSSLDYL